MTNRTENYQGASMIKKLVFLTVLLTFFSLSKAQTQTWIWGLSPVSENDDTGEDVVVDDIGNSYVTGTYQSTQISFGNYTLTNSNSGEYNTYVAKLSPSGQWLWVKGIDHCRSTGIDIDPEGNLVVVGGFYGTMILDSISLTNSSGATALFVAKLSAGGDWIWAVNSINGSYGGFQSEDVAVDINSDIYITGYGFGSVSCGEHQFGSIGQADIFTCKLSSSGNWLWARNAGSTIQDHGNGIAVDEFGNAYVAAISSAGSGMNGDYSQVMIIKYDATGNVIWQYQSQCSRTSSGKGITTDGEYVYLTGSYLGDFQICGQTLPYANPDRVFLLKLSLDGSFEWIRQHYVSGVYVSAKDIAIDKQGNAYLIGSFGTGKVWKIDNLGNSQSVLLSGGSSLIPNGICIDISGAIYLTGTFSGSVSFNDITLISSGGSDVFVVKRNSLSPLVSFVPTIIEGLEPLHVEFTDSSIPGSGAITDWYWDFGDGFSSILQSPEHVFLNAGSYTVSLMVTNNLGYSATIVCNNCINVLPRFPEIDVNDATLDVGNVYLGSQSIPHDVWIKNIGTNPLLITSMNHYLTNSMFEVTGINLPLSIAEGDSTSFQVLFTPIHAGTIIDSLYILNNSENQPTLTLLLKGKGEIVPPKPPQDIAINMISSNAVISWDQVTHTIHNSPIVPDCYIIFHNGSSSIDGLYYFLGVTTELNYTHYGVGRYSPNMFYRVIAYKDFAGTRLESAVSHLTEGMTEDEVIRILEARQ